MRTMSKSIYFSIQQINQKVEIRGVMEIHVINLITNRTL
jgi:hypothetical protein